MSSILSRLPRAQYSVLNDLLIKYNGHSTQIDHVVVSIYGIFVIETKFYDGWISGGESSELWTQNLYGKKYTLRNPLWQNQGHIMALKRLLNDNGKIPYYSIVCFSSKAKLMVNKTLPVMYWNQVVPYIKRFRQVVMSEAMVESISNTLIGANVTDRSARKEHVRSVKQNQIRRDMAVSSGKCPQCGGNLVIREGKYGRFYGCSNYPNCRYILKH